MLVFHRLCMILCIQPRDWHLINLFVLNKKPTKINIWADSIATSVADRIDSHVRYRCIAAMVIPELSFFKIIMQTVLVHILDIQSLKTNSGFGHRGDFEHCLLQAVESWSTREGNGTVGLCFLVSHWSNGRPEVLITIDLYCLTV